MAAVALPVGLHLTSSVSFPRLATVLAPSMADCAAQPAVSELVSRADALYQENKIRDCLQYLKQYEHLDEVEVTKPLMLNSYISSLWNIVCTYCYSLLFYAPLSPFISLSLSLSLSFFYLSQVLWRLARLCYKMGKYNTEAQEEKKRLAGQGWGYIERALGLGGDRNNGCRRWAGILLSWSSEFEGIKKKIEKSFEIRDHFLVRLRVLYGDEGDNWEL